MSLRTRHLACLFLLVSTLGASQASGSRVRHGFYGDRITAILYRHAIDSHSEQQAQNLKAGVAADPETLLIPPPSRAAFHTTWTMRPPVAHSAAVFAATSFARSAAL